MVMVIYSRATCALMITVAAGRLIVFAGLDADHPAFDMVDPADTVPAGDHIQFVDQCQQVHFFAVKADRQALFESQLDIFRFVREFCPVTWSNHKYLREAQFQGSSSTPHSMALPQGFSSME